MHTSTLKSLPLHVLPTPVLNCDSDLRERTLKVVQTGYTNSALKMQDKQEERERERETVRE